MYWRLVAAAITAACNLDPREQDERHADDGSTNASAR